MAKWREGMNTEYNIIIGIALGCLVGIVTILLVVLINMRTIIELLGG